MPIQKDKIRNDLFVDAGNSRSLDSQPPNLMCNSYATEKKDIQLHTHVQLHTHL
jgi:hypothetical protein